MTNNEWKVINFSIALLITLLFSLLYVQIAFAEDTPTPTVTPTVTPNPLEVIVTPDIAEGLQDIYCQQPTPIGFGTVTPSARWSLLCSQCIENGEWAPAETPQPTPTWIWSMPTVTPMPAYDYTGQLWPGNAYTTIAGNMNDIMSGAARIEYDGIDIDYDPGDGGSPYAEAYFTGHAYRYGDNSTIRGCVELGAEGSTYAFRGCCEIHGEGSCTATLLPDRINVGDLQMYAYYQLSGGPTDYDIGLEWVRVYDFPISAMCIEHAYKWTAYDVEGAPAGSPIQDEIEIEYWSDPPTYDTPIGIRLEVQEADITGTAALIIDYGSDLIIANPATDTRTVCIYEEGHDCACDDYENDATLEVNNIPGNVMTEAGIKVYHTGTGTVAVTGQAIAIYANDHNPEPEGSVENFCAVVEDGEMDEGLMEWGGLEWGELNCFDLGPYEINLLGFSTGIPWIAHICLKPVSLGDVSLFGVSVSMNLMLGVMAVVAVIRKLTQ